MKKIFILAGTLAFLACGTSKEASSKSDANVDQALKYAKTITAEELKEHLYTYASDEFEGRNTGAPGQKKAVEYLKKHYVDLGIPSPLGKDDYFQEVPLKKAMAPEINISINGTSYTTSDDVVAISGSTGSLTASEVVYLGYGIDTEKYSSYTNMNVDGKVVLIKAGEPKNGENYVISGSAEQSQWSNRQQYRVKSQAAFKRGAKAVMMYSPAMYGMIKQYYGGNSGAISLVEKGEKKAANNYFFVNEKIAKSLVADIETNTESKNLTANFSMSFTEKSEDLASENVVAFLEGSEFPNEVLVISSHLDHEGIKNGEIYNGADDDGSGTVTMLELAEAFKMAAENGKGPKRSILFLHVTGEEKGLLGSRYYTDMDPIFPLANTFANLNIDMVGRIDPKRKSENRNYVYLIGSDKLSTELHQISEDVNAKYMNIDLDYTYNDENDPNRFYYRSDHYNFAKNNIPIIFYFNGTHADYHRPSDTPDKIEYDLLENRARLVFHTAWELVNRDKKIVADKAEPKTESAE